MIVTGKKNSFMHSWITNNNHSFLTLSSVYKTFSLFSNRIISSKVINGHCLIIKKKAAQVQGQ